MTEYRCYCGDPDCKVPPPTRRQKAVAWFTTRDWLPMWLRRRVFRWLAFR
jgi:hypothetical protein